MKNIVYFFYFLKTTDYKLLKTNLKKICVETGKPTLAVILRMVRVSLKYGASFKDFWVYGFYNMSDTDIDKYVTTGRLYEFYSTLNDKKYIGVFRNKERFNEVFQQYIGRDYRVLGKTSGGGNLEWLSEKGCIVAKPSCGAEGVGIKKINPSEWDNKADLVKYLTENGLYLMEDCVKQHERINKINPSSVNTIRVVTVLDSGRVDIIAAAIRIGVNQHVDNFSAGGIAAPVDVETGVVIGPAVSKQVSDEFEYHPITGSQIVGFKIPYWDKAVGMVTKAAMVVPQVRTVGWDVAITQLGPLLIEGNHNWNKDAFQIPYGRGRQHVLDRYLPR